MDYEDDEVLACVAFHLREIEAYVNGIKGALELSQPTEVAEMERLTKLILE